MAETQYRYAANTVVSIEKTQSEIRKLLDKYGSKRTGIIEDTDLNMTAIGFKIPLGPGPKDIGEFVVYVPHPDETVFSKSRPPKRGTGQSTAKINERFKSEYEHEEARLLRVVFILLTAKLAAVDGGVTTIEKEFTLDQVVYDERGNRTTVYSWIAPQLQELRASGKLPEALPGTITGHPRIILPKED